MRKKKGSTKEFRLCDGGDAVDRQFILKNNIEAISLASVSVALRTAALNEKPDSLIVCQVRVVFPINVNLNRTRRQ